MNLVAILWLTALFLPNGIPQALVTAKSSGGSITFGASVAGENGSTTTTVSTTALNLPASKVSGAFCFFRSTTSGQTITFSDTAGNTWTASPAGLQYNAAAGSSEEFYNLSTTANSSDTGTCTLSSTTGGGTVSGAEMWYINGASAHDASNIADDGGTSGTTITSGTFTTTSNVEFMVQCAGVSVDNTTFTLGTFGGNTATALMALPGGGPNYVSACQYYISTTTISSGTAVMTFNGSTRWDSNVDTFH